MKTTKTTKTETGSESIPKDKRTKAYKEYVKKHSEASDGLGDVVEKITEATGIKKAVKFIAGEDCGCDERKEKLNRLFPSRKPECFTEAEFDLMKMAIDTKKNKFSPEEVKLYAAIYERIFRTKVECTQCSFRNTVWNALTRIYKEYS
jgi:predicted Zn-ribbon and HTH transcriptional regulator